MEEKRICSTCIWCNKPYQECRYNPPSTTGFPIVRENDWCMMHTLPSKMAPTLNEEIKRIKDLGLLE